MLSGWLKNKHIQKYDIIITQSLVLLLILGEELLGIHRLHRLRSSLLGEVLEQEPTSHSQQHHNGNPIIINNYQ